MSFGSVFLQDPLLLRHRPAPKKGFSTCNTNKGGIWVYQVVDGTVPNLTFPGDFQGFCGGPDLFCGQPEVRQVLLFSLVISALKVRQVCILEGGGVIVRQLQLEFQVVF